MLPVKVRLNTNNLNSSKQAKTKRTNVISIS